MSERASNVVPLRRPTRPKPPKSDDPRVTHEERRDQLMKEHLRELGS